MYRDNFVGVKTGVVYDARPAQINMDTISFHPIPVKPN